MTKEERDKSIRSAAKVFTQAILDNTTTCADQAVAIRKVREAVMISNSSITLE